MAEDRIEMMEELFTDLNRRVGRMERAMYILIGLMAGMGIVEISKIMGAIG